MLSASETTLQRTGWQGVLFAQELSRPDLLRLRPSWPLSDLRIRVHRNHSFEHVASAMGPFLAFGGLNGLFSYSDYDDSLGLRISGEADIEVVWLDYDRYRSSFDGEGLARWLEGRLGRLRQVSDAPVLAFTSEAEDGFASAFNLAVEASVKGIPGARLCDLRPVRRALDARYYDERAAKFSGTRLSDAACLHIAREMACRWLPAAVRPRLKAVLLDLDNTLYSGVLGEDGPEGVVISPGHSALQEHLAGLWSQGLFLGLVSRNEPADVERLFALRDDFPLKWRHFSARSISWAEKAAGIEAAARALRIGLDAVLFVDDNPGELAHVAEKLPELHTLHAGEDGDSTHQAVIWYPGLWAWETGEVDHLRAADLEASAVRAAQMAAEPDAEGYFRSLQVSLSFAVNPTAQLGRLHELSQKTNQFNLSLSRLDDVALARRMASPESRVVSIRLKDRLSDSGVIGLVVGRREKDTLVVEELCISCRALGRDLEDVMAGEAVRLMLERMPCSSVVFNYRTGPRNEPGRSWLSRLAGRPLDRPEGPVTAPESFGRHTAPLRPVQIAVEEKT